MNTKQTHYEVDHADSELLDDIRAFRATRRRVRCVCSFGPDPDCPMDHQGVAEDIAIAGAKKAASAEWISQNWAEIDEINDPLLWGFLVAEDYTEFGKRIKDAIERKAHEHAQYEHERAEVSL